MLLQPVLSHRLREAVLDAERACAFRRWLHPAIYVLTAAFDTLDVETARAGSRRDGAPRKPAAQGIDWPAAEDSTPSRSWSLKQWWKHVLGFTAGGDSSLIL